jgi:arylsulfatase A-like enzyme
MLAAMDESIGQMIQFLREQKLYDNTLIIFSSDVNSFIDSKKIPIKMHITLERRRYPIWSFQLTVSWRKEHNLGRRHKNGYAVPFKTRNSEVSLLQ